MNRGEGMFVGLQMVEIQSTNRAGKLFRTRRDRMREGSGLVPRRSAFFFGLRNKNEKKSEISRFFSVFFTINGNEESLNKKRLFDPNITTDLS